MGEIGKRKPNKLPASWRIEHFGHLALNLMNKIPEIFKSSDTVFHYCKLNTAVESILYNKKLRLSPRRESSDPVERLKPIILEGGWFNPGENPEEITENIRKPIEKVKKLIHKKFEKCRQVCFCMNDRFENYSGFTTLPLEFYGFLKPRMWDQYADNYKGVCLAFSINELIKNNNLIYDKIDYFKYSEIYYNHKRIDLNDLLIQGERLYIQSYQEVLNKMLFRKHEDYCGEKEFRLCTFSKNEFVDIDISTSIRGIIVSENFTSDFYRDILNDYAEKMKIELLNVFWGDSSISFSDKRDLDKIMELFE